MRTYKNKEELKKEINRTYTKYILEFETIPEELKDKRVEEVDRTPAENLAYQVGWTNLILKWENDERYKFIHVNTVAPFGTFRTKIRKWKRLAL